VSRCGNPSVCLATRNAVPPASLLLWCLGATDRGWTGTLGDVRDLECMAKVSGKRVAVDGDSDAGDWLLLYP
jgi:hypothetical protein